MLGGIVVNKAPKNLIVLKKNSIKVLKKFKFFLFFHEKF